MIQSVKIVPLSIQTELFWYVKLPIVTVIVLSIYTLQFKAY